MGSNGISDDAGGVVSIDRQDLERLLAESKVLEEREAMTGPIRVIERASDAALFVQESTDDGVLLLRAVPSVEEARRFLALRLTQYERMWDGCGCRIDYFSATF
jgi:hypothetical protein